MTSPYLYVFCAIRRAAATHASLARAAAKLPAMPEGSPPRVLPLAKDIALVVAEVPPEIYGAGAIEAKLTDLDWLARCGAAHHAVVDRLAKTHVVVPFRLFTLFSSEAKALATLRRSRARLAAAMTRVTGRAEWVLRIGKPDPSLAAFDEDRIAAREGSGTSFLQAKAQARKAETERATRVLDEANAVFDTLSAIADHSSAHPIDAGTSLILDAAFLVPVRRTAPFRKTLRRAASGLLRDGCRVSLTGPWPPYSFVDLTSASRLPRAKSSGVPRAKSRGPSRAASTRQTRDGRRA